jgi:ribosomal protein L35
MAGKLKKIKPKTKSSLIKRLKKTGSKNDPKLLTNRINNGHRLIKKSRVRKLKAKTKTVLSNSHSKYLKVI